LSADSSRASAQIVPANDPNDAVSSLMPIGRENLADRAYAELRNGLLQGRFWPGERLKIRDVAKAMRVSETPVREAMLQLAREGGFEIIANRSIRVVRLSLSQYLELREIRLNLEGLAGEVATAKIRPDEIDVLEKLQRRLLDAQKREDWPDAIRAGCEFHFRLYGTSGMPELVKLLEQIWLRTAPLLNLLYHAGPDPHPDKHFHFALIDALRAKDVVAVRQALKDDLVIGGARLVKLMEDIESGRAVVNRLARGDGVALPPAE